VFWRIPQLILENEITKFLRNDGNRIPSDTFSYSRGTDLSDFSCPSDYSFQRLENGFVRNVVMNVKVKY
jgi:hypothetical protein